MIEHQVENGAAETAHASEVVQREAGLRRELKPHQVAMIGLGCTIGTGLFLGSAIAVKLAGPAVIVSFSLGALVALTVMWALAEMSVEHPTAGAFGLHAEMYLHPWAGFAIRYTYWLCLVVIIGSEVVAAAIYCQYWFPNVPAWLWIAGFSLAMIYINTLSIENFRNAGILVRDDQGRDHRCFSRAGCGAVVRFWVSSNRGGELHGSRRLLSWRIVRRSAGSYDGDFQLSRAGNRRGDRWRSG